MSRVTRSKKLLPQEISALLDENSDEEGNINELYSQEELQEAAAPAAPAGPAATPPTAATAEVDDDLDFTLSESEEEDEVESGSKKKLVHSIETSLDEKNYVKYKVPAVMKKYSVKVKPEVRPEAKVEWVNKQPQQAAGRQAAHNVITTPIGVIGAPGLAAVTHLKAWELFFDSEIIQSIVFWTNQEIRGIIDSLPQSVLDSDKNTHLGETDEAEIRAVIGKNPKNKAYLYSNKEGTTFLFVNEKKMYFLCFSNYGCFR